MRHSCSALAPILVLVALTHVSAMGRAPGQGTNSLRAQAPRSSGPNVASQNPSPAEVEEQEEDEGTQEQDMGSAPPAPAQQESVLPVMMQVPSQSAAQMAALSEAEAKVTEQANPADLASTESSNMPAEEVPVPSLPSLIADGVVPDSSLPEDDSDGKKTIPSMEVHVVNDAKDPIQQDPFQQVNSLLSARPSPTASAMAASEELKKAFPTPFPVTVPGMSAPLSYADAVFMPSQKAKELFPTKSESTALHAAAPKLDPNFNMASKEKYSNCNPPCIQGRGICNDNVCFCKSPHTGTTCQHELNPMARASTPMVVAFAGVCFVMGVLLAQGIHAWLTRIGEQRLQSLGNGFIKKEIWNPPTKGKKGARGGAH